MGACALAATVIAFYVSSDGSDSNPGTFTRPFATLEAAQRAMQDGNSKTAFVRGGLYSRTRSLRLTKLDDGETWSTYPCDPPRSAVFDGKNIAPYIFSIMGGSNITITNITLQNMRHGGVLIHGGAAVPRIRSLNMRTTLATNNVVSESEIGPITGDDVESVDGGAVSAEGAVPGTLVLNNYIHDTTHMGIELKTQHNPAANPPDDISNGVISGNILLHTNTVRTDGGAIYLHDWLATSTNIRIEHNFIRDWQAPSGTSDHCIYLDAAVSNVSVTGNVCGPPGPGAANQSAVIILCGNRIKIEGNIIDLGSTGHTTLIGVGTCAPPAVLTDMTGITFKQNIVVSNFPGNQDSIWSSVRNKAFATAGPPPNYLMVAGNLYHNYRGGQEITTGNVASDTKPVLADPLCSGWDYHLADDSRAYREPVNFPRLIRHWGPQDFVIPHAGTAPSCPH